MTTFLYAQKSVAENNLNTFKKGFYVGVETGVGWPQFKNGSQDESREGRFIFGLYGGYRPLYTLRAGFKIDEYFIEDDDYSPGKGISISNASFQVQVFPFKNITLFTNLQYGWSKYNNNHILQGYEANGTSQKIGLGYEYNLNKHFALSLNANYGFGKFNDVNDVSVTIHDQNYDSWDITLCVTYR